MIVQLVLGFEVILIYFHFISTDSDASAQREIQFFFPEFSWSSWYRDEESTFREGKIGYDPDNFLHKI